MYRRVTRVVQVINPDGTIKVVGREGNVTGIHTYSPQGHDQTSESAQARRGRVTPFLRAGRAKRLHEEHLCPEVE